MSAQKIAFPPLPRGRTIEHWLHAGSRLGMGRAESRPRPRRDRRPGSSPSGGGTRQNAMNARVVFSSEEEEHLIALYMAPF